MVGAGRRVACGVASERNPRPFTWHKSAEEILDRLVGYCRAPDPYKRQAARFRHTNRRLAAVLCSET
jgi:hypothetical protein